MNEKNGLTSSFFSVVTDTKSYLNILYLLLAFPLGIFYFVFLVTGISMGVGMLVIVVGAFILTFVLFASKKFMIFERRLASVLLGKNYIEVRQDRYNNFGYIRRSLLEAGEPENWKALFYLLSKFFIGIITFTVCVTLISVSVTLICAPFILQLVVSNVGSDMIMYYYHSWPQYLGLNINPFEESVIYMFAGMLLGVLTLHITNFMAYVLGEYLSWMSPNPNKMIQNTLHNL